MITSIVKVLKILLKVMFLSSGISLCMDQAFGERAVHEQISKDEIKINIVRGMAFQDVTSYLEENSIKYFIENKGDFTEMSFAVNDRGSVSKVDIVEKLFLFIVTFNNNEQISYIKIEEVYKGP